MELNPLNDKTISVELYQRDPTTAALSPVTGGTVQAFVASSDAPDATPADVTLQFSATHIGGANGFTNGTWSVFIDGALLTAVLMATLPRRLWLVVQKTDDIRAVVELENIASRYATVSS